MAACHTGGVRWVPFGPQAIMIYFADSVGEDAFRRGRAIGAALERHPPPGLRECVPSFTAVLLEFGPEATVDGDAVVSRLRDASAIPLPDARRREIPVRYDGEDLPALAEKARLSAADFAERHAAPVYKVYSLGFAPGFPYLGDLPDELHAPRLASPRPRVPAGAVAIGGEHTGIYPLAGPGGWNLIGTTSQALFDPAAAPDDRCWLRPGDLVKFIPVA